jgi:NAD(P)-dependent dehydrogenase (short-subunit alcohol dehydrogenase family)
MPRRAEKFESLRNILIWKAEFDERQTRKFAVISTGASSIGRIFPLPVTAYGTSKAAVNFIARSLNHEHNAEGFVIFPIRSG